MKMDWTEKEDLLINLSYAKTVHISRQTFCALVMVLARIYSSVSAMFESICEFSPGHFLSTIFQIPILPAFLIAAALWSKS